jgi:glycosyltransferase involved in cell wall biosynthesis
VSLLEAMAAGLAPIVPDNAGNREWVENHKSGLLFVSGDVKDLAACITFLLDNHASAVEMGARAREVVAERGRWAVTIRRAEMLFDQLAGAR